VPLHRADKRLLEWKAIKGQRAKQSYAKRQGRRPRSKLGRRTHKRDFPWERITWGTATLFRIPRPPAFCLRANRGKKGGAFRQLRSIR
jgi:hypothetical protein